MRKSIIFILLLVVISLLGFITLASASQPIELFTGFDEINKLKFVTYQNFHDTDANGLDAGDWFEGIFKAQSITDISGTKELTAQLNDRELTGHFKFSVAGVSDGHADLAFGATDFMEFYTGSGANMNWDPADVTLDPVTGVTEVTEAIKRATDGDLWLSIDSSSFEGSSDSFASSYSFTEAWANVTTNLTGYTILPQTYPTVFNPTYPGHNTSLPAAHTGHPSDVYFQSLASGSNISGWDIRSEDVVYLAVAPEPISSVLFLSGGAVLGFSIYRKKKV